MNDPFTGSSTDMDALRSAFGALWPTDRKRGKAMRTKWVVERDSSIQYFDGGDECADFLSRLPKGELFVVHAPDAITLKDRETLDRHRRSIGWYFDR